jgi:hypothetical protein
MSTGESLFQLSVASKRALATMRASKGRNESIGSKYLSEQLATRQLSKRGFCWPEDDNDAATTDMVQGATTIGLAGDCNL